MTQDMNLVRIKFLLVSAAALGLAGCTGPSSRVQGQGTAKPREEVAQLATERTIYVHQRALPSRITNVAQPAHYQHVFIDSADPAALTVQTISLEDAVASNVLASAELEVRPLRPLAGGDLTWAVVERDFRRPSELEGIGGADAQKTVFRELKFEVGKADVLDKSTLDDLLRLASRVDGLFYVVGYADESGVESKNKALSLDRARAVAQHLEAGGVHPGRIRASGAGVSRLYRDLQDNRRVSVSFLVDVR